MPNHYDRVWTSRPWTYVDAPWMPSDLVDANSGDFTADARLTATFGQTAGQDIAPKGLWFRGTLHPHSPRMALALAGVREGKPEHALPLSVPSTASADPGVRSGPRAGHGPADRGPEGELHPGRPDPPLCP